MGASLVTSSKTIAIHPLFPHNGVTGELWTCMESVLVFRHIVHKFRVGNNNNNNNNNNNRPLKMNFKLFSHSLQFLVCQFTTLAKGGGGGGGGQVEFSPPFKKVGQNQYGSISILPDISI